MVQPEHSKPPFCGMGSSHRRSRVRKPLPQLDEHSVHGPVMQRHCIEIIGDIGQFQLNRKSIYRRHSSRHRLAISLVPGMAANWYSTILGDLDQHRYDLIRGNRAKLVQQTLENIR